MSLQTWIDEFGKNDLQKWIGLRKENLKKHNVVLHNVFIKELDISI